MKIRFRKKSKAEWAIVFILTMPFLFFILMDLFNLPSLTKYTVDLVWIYVLLCLIKNRSCFPNAESAKLLLLVSIFFFLTIPGFVVNLQSPFYYLWGLRNNVRFFVFFFGCVFFVNYSSIPSYLAAFDKVFWLNIPIVLYQYFIQGYQRDYLGGLFGIERGCNGYMNIFLMIIVTKSIVWYLNKQESLRTCLSKIVGALIIAVLSEMKVFFIELILIITLAMSFQGSSTHKFWIVASVGIAVVISVQMIAVLFPEFTEWFSLDSIVRILSARTGYTNSGDMNRFTAISISLEHLLPDNWSRLFGLGLGNCDYASFSFLITPFYQRYRRLNYTFFSSSFLVLETGIIGLGLYVSFFIYLYYAVKKTSGNRLIAQMARILSIMSIILIIYNSSLRTEAAFMLYFILALPFVRKRNGNAHWLENV